MAAVRQDDATGVRRQSFGEVASHYDRFRPGPPDEALDWLLPAAAHEVLEIGAGTGALTRRLLERGLHVRAVEPDDRMRAVLVERAAAAEVVAGAAEEIPAPDSSVDMVIAASAWHWVDEERAVPEVVRVLRPGGRFALLWSGPNRRTGWLRAAWAGGADPSEERIAALEARRGQRFVVDLGDGRAFSEPERHLLQWTVAMSREELLGLFGTYSAVITMEPVARREYFDSVNRFLDRDGASAGRESFDVPMGCVCWRATRL
jgi:SAM-dependent methyltransferase